MSSFAKRVAVVTGAGSGIGQALSIALGRRGARLAISDVSDDGFADTAAQLEALGAPTHTQRAVNLWGVIKGTKEFLPHLILPAAGMSSISPASTGLWANHR